MKYKAIWVAAAAIAFFGCNSNNQKQAKKIPAVKDTVGYSNQTILETSDDCKGKTMDSCATAQFTFPVFNGKDALNDTVRRKLVFFFNAEKNPKTDLRECAKLFLKAYAFNKKQKPNIPPFKLNSLTKVMAQYNGLTTIGAGVFIYMGYDNGHNILRFINWNQKANKEVSLDDILTGGNSKELNKIAEGIFRQNEHLSDTASLQPNFHFRDNKFLLTDNYLITPQGLGFYYNKFQLSQLKPVEILIPYDKLKPLMKPNTVLSQFVNQ